MPPDAIVPDSYWVTNGLAAGPYPGALDSTVAASRIEMFTAAGVHLFVDLTTPADGLEPYADLLEPSAAPSHIPAVPRIATNPRTDAVRTRLEARTMTAQRLDNAFLDATADFADVRRGLEELWRLVRDALQPEDDQALGLLHVGTDADVPWAHTNAGEDRVNLTIELPPDAIELNVVGWKETQADALKNWLQSVAGEKTVATLDGYEVVAFARVAYKKTPSSRPWWQDETITELGRIAAPQCDTRWVTQQVLSLGHKSEVKPAFHIRRRWTRDFATDLGDELPAALAAEVVRLMPILRAIWATS